MPKTPRGLRLNPSYRLARTRDADPAVLAQLGHSGIPGDYGLLRSRHPGQTVKLVSPDLADFLERLPISEVDALDALGDVGIALIFDDIIQRRMHGRWASGPTVVSPSTTQAIDRTDPGIAAVLESRHRTDLSPSALGRHLYEFGRRPFGPRWVETVGGTSAGALTAWFGLDRAPRFHAVTSRWRHTKSSEWWTWYSTSAPDDSMGWKIYVNVVPESLPRALTLVSELLDLEGASAFKVAGNVRAALRPDKLVIYFPDRDAMAVAGRALVDGLSGLPVQPLPFTARLGVGNRITWGTDPPRGQWMARGSWRMWLCSKIAGVMAGLCGCVDEDVFLDRFATRMSADGIRIDDWAPRAWLFDAPPAPVRERSA